MGQRLEYRPKTIKPLQENLGSKLLDLRLDEDSLTRKVKATKEKINKQVYIKLKTCTAKETNNMKRQCRFSAQDRGRKTSIFSDFDSMNESKKTINGINKKLFRKLKRGQVIPINIY